MMGTSAALAEDQRRPVSTVLCLFLLAGQVTATSGSKFGRMSVTPLSGGSAVLADVAGKSCEQSDLREALSPLPCEATIARLRDSLLEHPEPVQGEAHAEKLAEAAALASKLFRVPPDALRNEVKRKRKGSEARAAKQPREAKACQRQFKGDTGSVMRCFVQEGLLSLAMSLADEFLAENRQEMQYIDTDKFLKQTYVLVQFGLAYLTDLVFDCVGKPDLATRRLCAMKYLDFTVTAGDLHMFTEQLGQLLLFAHDRMVRLDIGHADHYLVLINSQPSFGIVTLDPKSDSRFSHQMRQLGYWEPGSTALLEVAIKRRILRSDGMPSSIVVDVGANLGWFTLLAASKGVPVLAFEPVPEHCRKLRQSLSLNGFTERVRLIERAVSRQAGPLELHVFEVGPSPTAYVLANMDDNGHRSGSELHKSAGHSRPSLEAATTTVDESVEMTVSSLISWAIASGKASRDLEPENPGTMRPLSAVGVLKIDAEGCELEALLSAASVIEASGPDLVLELCPHLYSRCGTTAQEEARAWNMLQRLGYQSFVFHHDAGAPSAPLERLHALLNTSVARSPKSSMWPMYQAPSDPASFRAWIEKEKATGGCFLMWSVKDSQSMSEVLGSMNSDGFSSSPPKASVAASIAAPGSEEL